MSKVGAGGDLSAAVCFGAVMHHRKVQADHRFKYPIAYLRVPLSALDALRVPLLGVNRANLFALHARDHGARDGSPLLPWIRALLASHGVAEACDGEVVLQTLPRMFGYVFNPVSFWFCHDLDGQLRVVLAEVSNTFGEHHNYLIHHDDLRPIQNDEELVARKVFHVSPFFPVKGEYRFRFSAGTGFCAADIDYHQGDTLHLRTRLSGRPRPLSGAAMLRWLLRHPLSTPAVMTRIHWQAFRLFLQRVSFFRKPTPPLEETTR